MGGLTWLMVFCSLVFAAGAIFGDLVGEWRGERAALREVAGEEAGARVAGQFRAMRPIDQAGWDGPQRADVAAGAQIPKPSPPPAIRAHRTSTAAFLHPPELAHEWDGHVAQALAITGGRPDPTASQWTQAAAEWLDGEIERRHADTDRWLAEHVYGVPYSADELWTGQ